MTEAPVMIVPEHYALVAEAMRGATASLRMALKSRLAVSSKDFEVPAAVSKHMDIVVFALGRIDTCIRSLNAVLSHESVSAVDAGRAVGRLEEVLFSLVEGYQGARSAQCAADTTGHAQEGRRLMMGVYRHYLNQCLRWMDRLAAALEDPVALAHSSKQPIDQGVRLSVGLTLTTPPQFQRLGDIAAEFTSTPIEHPAADTVDHESVVDRPRPSSPSALAHLGAFAFGLAVTNRAFRRHRS